MAPLKSFWPPMKKSTSDPSPGKNPPDSHGLRPIRGIYCFGLVCQSHLQGCGLPSGKHLKENRRGARNGEDCTVSVRFRNCQLHLCIAKQKLFLEFSLAKKTSTFVMPHVKPALIYSLASILLTVGQAACRP